MRKPRRCAGPEPRRGERRIYVTLEPCSHHGKTPPCADAIIAAGIARVVSALVDPNPEVAGAGHWRMAQAGAVVEVGLGADDARRAHAGHIRRVRDGRPNVMLKLAVSADEKVALAGRRPTAITGGRARNRVHLMRATNDALLTGIGTVLADDPLLTCRLPGMPSPVRIVLDGTLRLSPISRLVASARQVPLWVVTGEGASPERGQALTTQGVQLLHCAMSGGRLDLGAVLKLLAGRGITRLMVEAGPILGDGLSRGGHRGRGGGLSLPDEDRPGRDRCARRIAACRVDSLAAAEAHRQRGGRGDTLETFERS